MRDAEPSLAGGLAFRFAPGQRLKRPVGWLGQQSHDTYTLRQRSGDVTMDYKVVECDFISRTLELLQQYDSIVVKSMPEEKRFEVTLLINCLPYEYKKYEQAGSSFPEICKGDQTAVKVLDEQWGLRGLEVQKFKLNGKDISENDMSLRRIVAMLLHSIAHSQFGDGRMTSKPNGVSVFYQDSRIAGQRSKITKLNFVNRYRDTEFEASIAVDALRAFAVKLARTILTESACES
jgi:hypothetical protein